MLLTQVVCFSGIYTILMNVTHSGGMLLYLHMLMNVTHSGGMFQWYLHYINECYSLRWYVAVVDSIYTMLRNVTHSGGMLLC